MMDEALSAPNPWLEGLTRERLESEGHIRLNFSTRISAPPDPSTSLRAGLRESLSPHEQRFFLPFANGNFRTPSGKALLYNESLKAQALDPVASFVPPAESRHSENAKAFPLELLARKPDNFLNSTFSNIESVQAMEEMGLLELHPDDARKRSIRDGDMVRAFNRRGEIQLKARVDGRVSPGVVAAKLNWAKLTPGGHNINVLTSEKLTDLGNSATFYSVLVEVELFQQPA